MINLQDYDIFIFDCDGVILDSNKLKSDAFRQALEYEPEEMVEELVRYHKLNGGISRYEKFNYFYKSIKSSNNVSEDCDRAIEKFAAFVSKGLLEVNHVPGVISFFNKIAPSKDLFVNSGSDEKELRQIFEQRDISHYFKEIYGSPNTKEKNLKKILGEYGKNKQCIFFGDSNSDYLAASSNKIDFVYISDYSEWSNPNGSFAFQAKNFKYITI